MPFSESSSNLPNHKHDQTVTQDGGALDFNNATSGSMAAGSITYDDGAGHMQELGIGTPAQVLTVSGANLPSWVNAGGAAAVLTTQGQILYHDGVGLAALNASTAGHVLQTNGAGANPSWAPPSGAWNRIANQQQTGGASTFTISGLSSTGKFLEFKACLGSGGSDSERLRFGTGNSVDTGANYSYEITTNNGVTSTSSGVSYITLVNGNSAQDVYLSGSMSLDASPSGTGTGVRRGTILVRRASEQSFVTFEWDNSTSPLTDFQIFNWSGNDVTGDISLWASE